MSFTIPPMLVSIQDRKQSFNFPLHDVSVFMMASDEYQAKLRAPRRMLAWCYGLKRLCCLSPADRRFNECTSRCGHLDISGEEEVGL